MDFVGPRGAPQGPRTTAPACSGRDCCDSARQIRNAEERRRDGAGGTHTDEVTADTEARTLARTPPEQRVQSIVEKKPSD